jgi:hypothetical protein
MKILTLLVYVFMGDDGIVERSDVRELKGIAIVW